MAALPLTSPPVTQGPGHLPGPFHWRGSSLPLRPTLPPTDAPNSLADLSKLQVNGGSRDCALTKHLVFYLENKAEALLTSQYKTQKVKLSMVLAGDKDAGCSPEASKPGRWARIPRARPFAAAQRGTGAGT